MPLSRTLVLVDGFPPVLWISPKKKQRISISVESRLCPAPAWL